MNGAVYNEIDPFAARWLGELVQGGHIAEVDGPPGRVGMLRGYGNAIVSEVAATFISAALEAIGEMK